MQSDTRTSVAICIPCGDEVKSEFMLSIASLANYSAKYRLAIIRGSSSIVSVARNHCLDSLATLEQMHGWPFEWIFFLDSDMHFPGNALERLLAHDKDVVGATYIRRTPPYDLMSKNIAGGPLPVTSGIVEVLALPTGCLLLRRNIFEKLKRPYFRFEFDEENGVTRGEDYVLCKTLRSLGYRLFIDVDLTREMGHVGVHVFSVAEQESLRMEQAA